MDDYWLDCLRKVRDNAVNRFDASDIASKVASEINDFNPEEYMDPRKREEMTAMPNSPLPPPSCLGCRFITG